MPSQELDKTLAVALVIDRLDESLVVMADKLCWGGGGLAVASAATSWDPSDVAYLPVNVRKKPYEKVESRALLGRLAELLPVDAALVEWARQRLDEQLGALELKLGQEKANAAAAAVHEGGGREVEARVAALKGACQALGGTCSHQTAPESRRRRRRRLQVLGQPSYIERRRAGGGFGRGSERPEILAAKRSESPRHLGSFEAADLQQGLSKRREELRQERALAGDRPRASLGSGRHRLEESSWPSALQGGGGAGGGVGPEIGAVVRGAEPAGVADGDEQEPVTAFCWRHGANQVSYAQYLKALAGIPCLKK